MSATRALPGASGAARRAIGRDAERRLLDGLIESTVRGRGGVAVVEGVAGIGKTTLLAGCIEQARARDLRVRMATARELEQERPFGVIASALDIFASPLSPERQTAVEMLSRPRWEDASPLAFADLRYAVVDALATVIEREALTEATALVIDDLQWCDSSSIVTLGRVFRLAEELPLVVICALRPHPRASELAALLRAPEAARCLRLTLAPLDSEAVKSLVASVAGADPGPRLMRQALRCGGDPLFVTALLAAFAREGVLERSGVGIELVDDAGSVPPPAVSMLVLRQVSTLPRPTVDLLLIAAVLGSPFSLHDLGLASARRPSDLLADMRPAVEAGLIVEAGERLAFQHDLVRDAIYDDMGAPMRRALHRQVAEALAASSAAVGTIASHFAAAAEDRDAVAVAWLLRAGRDAAPRDPVAAVTLLRRALDLSQGTDDEGEVKLAYAQALAASGQLKEAESVLRSLASGSLQAEVHARARAALGQVLHLLGTFSSAADELAAAARSPALPDALRARLFAHSVMDRVWSGAPLDASEGDATRALAEARRVADQLAEFYSVMAQQRIARRRGSLGEAVALAKEAGRIASGVEPADEITHYEMPPVAVRIEADQFDEALEILQSAPAWREERGGAVQPQRLFQQMRCHVFTGEWDDAVAEGETGLSLAQASGTVWSIDATRAQLALLTARRDELARADVFLSAIKGGRGTDAESPVTITKAYIAIARGEITAARQIILKADRLLDNVGALRDCGAILAQIYAVVGARGEIRDITSALAPLAASASVPSLDGLVAFCGALADNDAERLINAAQTLRATRRVVDLASACEEAGDAVHSSELLSEALGLYERFGARRDRARTLARLRALGLRPGRRGSRQRPATGWSSLTPTERRIAELIAEGLLYKEIAERLVISRRTVETHVVHIFTKLSVGTRLELSRFVRQQVTQGS